MIGGVDEFKANTVIKIDDAASMTHPKIRAHAESVGRERIIGNSPSHKPRGAIDASNQAAIGISFVS